MRGMLLFLLFWLLNAAVLGAALLILHFAYQRLGGDFGLKNWRSELPTAMVVALLFTLIRNGMLVFGAADPTGRGTVALFGLGLFVIAGAYRATHLLEMEKLEVGLVSTVFLVVYLLGLFAILRIIGK